MFQPLDGPAKQGQANVTDAAVFRVKVGTNEFTDREVVTVLPLDGQIWVYFADEGETPSVSDVADRGFPQFKMSLRSYEAGPGQAIFIVADDGTVDVRFAERG